MGNITSDALMRSNKIQDFYKRADSIVKILNLLQLRENINTYKMCMLLSGNMYDSINQCNAALNSCDNALNSLATDMLRDEISGAVRDLIIRSYK